MRRPTTIIGVCLELVVDRTETKDWLVIEEDLRDGTIGPTFARLLPAERPQPLPACATCPKAMWYRTAKRIRSFCRELRHITWEEGETEPILQCDGREAALMLTDESPG